MPDETACMQWLAIAMCGHSDDEIRKRVRKQFWDLVATPKQWAEREWEDHKDKAELRYFRERFGTPWPTTAYILNHFPDLHDQRTEEQKELDTLRTKHLTALEAIAR